MIAAIAATLLVMVLPRSRQGSAPPSRSKDDQAAQSDPRPGIVNSTLRALRFPNMATAMFASLSVLSSVDVLIAYLPAYGEETGLSVRTVGFLWSWEASSE